jgi:hypothetical protein
VPKGFSTSVPTGVLHVGAHRGSPHRCPQGFSTSVPTGVLHIRSHGGSPHWFPQGFSTSVPTGVLHVGSHRVLHIGSHRGSPHRCPHGFSTSVPTGVPHRCPQGFCTGGSTGSAVHTGFPTRVNDRRREPSCNRRDELWSNPCDEPCGTLVMSLVEPSSRTLLGTIVENRRANDRGEPSCE